MKSVIVALVLLLLTCFISLYQVKEMFTSPGTLVQLATSHVPDETDIYALQNYRRQVRHDLIDLTGSA